MKENNDNNQHIGPMVRQYRLSRRWSYKRMAGVVAAVTGRVMSPNTIRNVERGRSRRPHEQTVYDLTQAFPDLTKKSA